MPQPYNDNFIELTDSYKWGHPRMYPEGTQGVSEYLAAREGAEFPETILFGLQGILKEHFTGQAFSQADIARAEMLSTMHLGHGSFFIDGWNDLWGKWRGVLPLHIEAVPEGLPIPVGNGNALMTVETTDDDFGWLATQVESLLMHVWHPTTVATLSWHIRLMIEEFVSQSGGTSADVNFMLHDFGFRSAAGEQAAKRGGAGHLVNFMGTDTIPALSWINRYYNDPMLPCAGFSVAASEHSVMTALGREGELDQLDHLLDVFPTGILSIVIDSYDPYAFIEAVIARKDRIEARDGKVVCRPDSTTKLHDTPWDLSLEIIEMLDRGYGSTLTSTDHKLLNSSVGVIWGDGLDREKIRRILQTIVDGGYAAHNMVFGMGGKLLHSEVERDTQRFAIKACAQKRDDVWHPIAKETLGKKSFAGQPKLVENEDYDYETVGISDPRPSVLETVFDCGVLTRNMTFGEVRRNAGWVK